MTAYKSEQKNIVWQTWST